MTTHQDNAARLARGAQILAIIILIVAVASFLIRLPANTIEPTNQGRNTGIIPGSGPGSASTLFAVPTEDWTTALSLLSASRDPVAIATGPDTDRFGNPIQNEPEPDTRPTQNQGNENNRPAIRYLGPLGDSKGLAALINFEGDQLLRRVGQPFGDNEYEITKITETSIAVSDGFEEFTFELATSTLAEVLPTQVNPNRGNPRAFPGGRNPNTQPGNPADQGSPRRPTPPTDDEGSPA